MNSLFTCIIVLQCWVLQLILKLQDDDLQLLFLQFVADFSVCEALKERFILRHGLGQLSFSQTHQLLQITLNTRHTQLESGLAAWLLLSVYLCRSVHCIVGYTISPSVPARLCTSAPVFYSCCTSCSDRPSDSLPCRLQEFPLHFHCCPASSSPLHRCWCCRIWHMNTSHSLN